MALNGGIGGGSKGKWPPWYWKLEDSVGLSIGGGGGWLIDCNTLDKSVFKL